jgi:hypothetical protein
MQLLPQLAWFEFTFTIEKHASTRIISKLADYLRCSSTFVDKVIEYDFRHHFGSATEQTGVRRNDVSNLCLTQMFKSLIHASVG